MQIKEHGIAAELKWARSRIRELEGDLDEFNQLSQELINMHESLNAKANHAGSLARSLLEESEENERLDIGSAIDVLALTADLTHRRAETINARQAYQNLRGGDG